MKIKASKKIIMAALALLMAVGLAAGSTFAWFSMNNRVEVSGMEVKTKVSSNLLITSDELSSTAKKADENFTAAPLVQTVKGILEPVSTINGTSFFYTKEANADGTIASGATYVAYSSSAASDTTNYDSAFSEYYGVTKTSATGLISGENGAKPYVDYVFQLKAVNTETSATKVKLTTLDLTYGAATDANKAYRVAVFVEDISGGTATAGVGELKAIYAHTSAENQTDGKAVNSTSTVGTVAYNGTAELDEVAANTTKYYKVVVRLWIEGEDTTCTNETFAALNNSWQLALNITFDNAAAGVTGLNMTTTP